MDESTHIQIYTHCIIFTYISGVFVVFLCMNETISKSPGAVMYKTKRERDTDHYIIYEEHQRLPLWINNEWKRRVNQ